MLIPDNKRGIYFIRCSANNSIYVGSSVTIRTRIQRHFRELKKGIHANSTVQNNWDKYGEEVFSCGVLELVGDGTLLVKEKYWIDFYGDSTMNIIKDPCDLGGDKNIFFGKKHTDDTKKIMAQNHADFRGDRNPFYGKSHSDESKAKMALGRKSGMTREQVVDVRRYGETETPKWIANKIGVSADVVRNILSGKTYSSVN